MISEFKILKRIVRFGNLDEDLREKFWIHRCPIDDIKQSISKELNIGIFENAYRTITDKIEEEALLDEDQPVRLSRKAKDEI